MVGKERGIDDDAFRSPARLALNAGSGGISAGQGSPHGGVQPAPCPHETDPACVDVTDEDLAILDRNLARRIAERRGKHP